MIYSDTVTTNSFHQMALQGSFSNGQSYSNTKLHQQHFKNSKQITAFLAPDHMLINSVKTLFQQGAFILYKEPCYFFSDCLLRFQ